MALDQYFSGKENILRTIWRISAFILIIITLVYFVPVIAYQSVLKLPLSHEWAYVLILCAIAGLLISVEAFCDSDNKYFAGILWVMSLAWLVAFGLFAKIYLSRGKDKAQRYKGTNTSKMQVGTWILLFDTVWWVAFATFFSLLALKAHRAKHPKNPGDA